MKKQNPLQLQFHKKDNFKRKKREEQKKGLLKLKSNNIKEQPHRKRKLNINRIICSIGLGFTKNPFPGQFKNQKLENPTCISLLKNSYNLKNKIVGGCFQFCTK